MKVSDIKVKLCLGAVFVVQAGIFLLACFGFLFVYWTLKKNGNQDFSVLVNEEDEVPLRHALRNENIEQIE